uniref:Replication-associated protein n=1 Tax=East African cassava mosaic Cameroon virus TaxID=223262 RepID=U5KI45_9GEMI|nr:Rep [East African cassava mosaic Cameroon virus]
MPRAGRFQINAKNYFHNLSPMFLNKGRDPFPIESPFLPDEYQIHWVCSELHQDGVPHLHVLIQFEGKFQCTNPRFFDLSSPSRSTQFHPNIQGAKSSSDVKAYIEKGGEFLDDGIFQVDARSARGEGQHLLRYMQTRCMLLLQSEALQIIKEKDPKSFFFTVPYHICYADRIFQGSATNIRYVRSLSSPVYTSPRRNRSMGIRKYLQSRCAAMETDQYCYGRCSRTGKTMWARSLGPHNYLCGHLDLSPKVYSNDAWYNVIDDVDPHYLKHFKEFMGAQRDWQSNTKYGKPIQIKGGIPTIFLCNPGPNSSYKEYLDEDKNSNLKNWAIKNALFISLTEPLFSSSDQSQAQAS